MAPEPGDRAPSAPPADVPGAVLIGSRRVDLAARQVWDGDREVHLEPQAFDVLAHLVANRDRVVGKAELLDEVWGSRFVTESALTTRVKEVRRALGDDGVRQDVVRTVRGRGYALAAGICHDLPRPGRAPPVGPSPLPASRTTLVGRDHDIAEVCDLLGLASLVTLVGPGGVGKTSLALAVARQADRVGTDQVLLVDLTGVPAGGAVLPALLRATGRDGRDEEAGLAALAHTPALVVLDNCEHVLDGAAEVVDRALRGGPLRILATSRERLGVAGERVWPVVPLPPAAAGTLLRDRVRQLAPTLSLADDDLVAQVVEALDRLPLAVEMAAALVPSLGLSGVQAVVAADQAQLASPARAVDARHRTLADVVSWSEGLLDPTQRRAFADLAVLGGPVGADDVAALVDGAGPQATIAALVERSLLVADHGDGEVRYHMLHTLRRHGLARLDETRRREAQQRRHAEWFTRVAEAADATLDGDRQLEGHRRLEAITAELRVAHAWARAHDPLLACRLTAALQRHAHVRLWAEPATWALALAETLPAADPWRAGALAAVANDDAHRGRLERGERLALEALEGDPHDAVSAVALEALADIALYRGDVGDAVGRARALARLGDRSGDRYAAVMGRVNEVCAHLYAGAVDRAVALLADLPDEAGLAPAQAGWVAYAHGEVRAGQDPAAALAALDRAVRGAEAGGDALLHGVARVSAASLRARVGDPREALAAFDDLIADWSRYGDRTHLMTTLRNLVPLLARVGATAAAARLLGVVEDPTAGTSFGAEADALADAAERLRGDAGADAVAAWRAEGRAQDLAWAAELARDVLADLRRGSTATS
jgi:predicted ATPase/DNA-binding winged helix-turn-helix (wHTH) protein